MQPTALSTAMPTATVAATLAIATEVIDELVVATARDTHGAVSRRVHGAVRAGMGPVGLPAEALHRGIAALVYGAVSVSLQAAGAGLSQVGAAGVGPTMADGPRRRFVHAAVNGLIGDELRRERPALAFDAGVRRDGRDVVLTPEGVAAAFPQAGGRLVVFVHGLCENEDYWGYHRERVGTTYPERLEGQGWTPVHLRINTGLPIRENGVAVAALLQRLVAAWPVDVDRIALVGHSMGGLIARAALAVQGDLRVDDWSDRVTDLVALGSPHLGAPLARLADKGVGLFAKADESRAFGAFLDRRSVGIRDLEFGLGEDLASREGVRFHLVSATLTRTPQHPIARTVGDLLVPPVSATGRDRRRGIDLFPGAEVLRLPHTNHFSLLNHPDVHPALERWLA